jgi:hypothetical protein
MKLRFLAIPTLVLLCALPALCQSAKEIRKQQLQRPCEIGIAGTPDELKPLIIAKLAPRKWEVASEAEVASQADLVLSRANSKRAIGKEAMRVMIMASNDGSWPSQVHTTSNVYFTFVRGDGVTTVRCRFDITYTDKFVPLAHAKGEEPDDKIAVLGALDELKH